MPLPVSINGYIACWSLSTLSVAPNTGLVVVLLEIFTVRLSLIIVESEPGLITPSTTRYPAVTATAGGLYGFLHSPNTGNSNAAINMVIRFFIIGISNKAVVYLSRAWCNQRI